jgi:glutamate dehydrogenase
MVVKAGDLELDLIDSVLDAVGARLGHEPSWPCAEFVRQYYHWVPAQDLRERSVSDLAGAVLGQWETLSRRQPGEFKVRVFNPDQGRDGWESPYTVIEIVCDDMPFLVDSVTMELSRRECAIELLVHPVMRVVRDAEGILAEVLTPEATDTRFHTESILHGEVARQSDPDRLSALQAGIELVLHDVRAAVEDWHAIRARAVQLAAEIGSAPSPCDPPLLAECQAFLTWLAERHFVFLGYREYELRDDGELCAVDGTGLGILRGAPRLQAAGHAGAGRGPPAAAAGALQGQLARDRPPPRVHGLHRGQALLP